MNEPEDKRDEGAPPPPPPPPIGVDRVEFRRAANDTHRAIADVGAELVDLRQEAGAVLLSLGLWALLTGWRILREAR